MTGTTHGRMSTIELEVIQLHLQMSSKRGPFSCLNDEFINIVLCNSFFLLLQLMDDNMNKVTDQREDLS